MHQDDFCPHCRKPIRFTSRIKISAGKEKAKREKKDKNEPMNTQQFIKRCKDNKKRPDIQFIGHFAESLKDCSEKWDGFKTRGQWTTYFFMPNIKLAGEFSQTWQQNGGQEQVAEAFKLMVDESRENNFKLGNLSTLKKYMVKVKIR